MTTGEMDRERGDLHLFGPSEGCCGTISGLQDAAPEPVLVIPDQTLEKEP